MRGRDGISVSHRLVVTPLLANAVLWGGVSLASGLTVGDHEPTMSSDHHPDRPTDRQGDQEATSYTIGQAARLLGVSENAVRQRIKRRSLPAAKVEGVWRVWLPDQEGRPPGDYQTDHPRDHEGDYQGDNQSDHEATSPSVAVSPAARAQLEAIRDQWLRPLVDRIGELEREAGRLQAEREAARRERDDLAARVADDRKLADQLVDVLQHERDAAVRDRDRVAARLAEGERWVETLTARVREMEAAASELPAETESRRLSGPAAPISPPAWRVWPPPSEKSPRRPRWRFWERGR